MPASFSHYLYPLLGQFSNERELLWLDSITKNNPQLVMEAFVKAPRFLSKTIVHQPKEIKNLVPEVPGFQVDQWNLVRLSRVWFLDHLSNLPKDEFLQRIETLFDTAELNELVALFSALPLFPYPEIWLPKATDAVRSNMGFVFDAISLNNPYPSLYFSELAWNQLVLKTIFNGKPIELIYGLLQRRNSNLSNSILDFVKERWAAGRDVPPNVWQLVAPFVSETDLPIIERLFLSHKEEDKIAATLLCIESKLPFAIQLLIKYPNYKEECENGIWNWSNLKTII
ncbi:EboA domain-containing protein [Leptospira sp. WS39.C2]